MTYPNYLFFLIPLLLFFLFVLLLSLKKKKSILKTRSLSLTEKTALLNHLVEPIGYIYNPHQDIFTSHINAPKKLFGYHTFYDFAAAFFNMVFDYETIYFDYRGRTWLIELWKGQYGINSGCELGVYYADKMVFPKDYDNTHFEAAAPKDMLTVSMELYKDTPNSTLLGHHQSKHWWLTIFKLGRFSKPADLSVNISLTFPDYRMLTAFWKLARFLVRHIWAPLEAVGVRDPTSAAKNNRKKNRLEKRYLAYTGKRGCYLLTGHTHTPSLCTEKKTLL